jgi:anaerobic selenocysteine-containing dehydrogenase
MVQGALDPLTGSRREDVLMAHEDAARLGLEDGDPIVLENEHGSYRGRARLAPILPGNLQGHWPEVNVLIPEDRLDPLGLVPDYNALVTCRRG